jgi:hypothetical protein
MNLLWKVVLVWLTVVLLAGYFGIFDAGSRYSMSVPVPLGLAALLPVLVFGIWFNASRTFRESVLALNPVTLTAVHTWRVGGIVFLILLAQGFLPASFAYPAGLGDIAVGLTAPLVAWSMSRKSIPARLQLAWQIAGITDLVVAIGMGVLSSPTPLGTLAPGATTRVMGLLPMSLVPTFIVPLLTIFHIICIAQARKFSPINAPSRGHLKISQNTMTGSA